MTDAIDRAMFAKLVKGGYAKSGETWAANAASCGISATHLKGIAAGTRMPSPEQAAVLAEHFTSAALVDIMTRLRTRSCLRCGATFRTRKHGNQQRYCDADCQNRAEYERRHDHELRGMRSELAAMKARQGEQSAAIAAFCASCEPEGHCRMASCELRAVSPLPLSRMAIA